MKTLAKLIIFTLIMGSSITSASAQSSQAAQAADLIRAKQYPAALKILNGNLTTLAGKAPAFTEDQLTLLKARALFHNKKHAESEAVCDKLIADFPDSPWKHKASFLKAHTLASRGKYDAALVIYETESTRLFSKQRKDEVAGSLLEFAGIFAKQPDPADLDAPKPDFQKAYNLYKEVLDIQCSTKLSQQAHFAMIRMSGHLQKWNIVTKDTLTFLKAYDPTWRGTMDSTQRLTFQKNTSAKLASPQRSEVRYRMAEALHRSDQRLLAVRYLDELTQLMTAGTIESPAGLAADAMWLKLMAMRHSSGRVPDIDLWVSTAKAYLKKHPNHLHASWTAFQIPSMLALHSQEDKAITAYQDFLKNPPSIKENPESLEKETPASFLKRKEKGTRNREEASYKIGQLHLNLRHFDQARTAWNQTAQDFPNGSRWADSQKGLVEVDYQEAMQAIREIQDDDAAKKAAAATRSATLLSAFLKAHPLSDKAPQILYLVGRIPHQLAMEMDDIENPTDEQKTTQKDTFQKAIQVWGELLSKYPKAGETARAREQIGAIYEQRIGDLEKALSIYKQSGSQLARVRQGILTSKRLIASSPKVFRTDENPELSLSLRNIEKVTIRQYWLDLDSYFRKARKLSNISELDVDLVEPDKQWDLDIEGYQKHLALEKKIPLPFTKGKPGVCVIKVEGGGFISTTVVVRSDIDIAVRSSKKELIALVTNWRKGGDPTAGVKLLIADGGKVVATGTTGKDGVLHLKHKELTEISDLRILAISASGAATCDLDLGSLVSPPVMQEKAWFNTPLKWYRPGEIVELSGLLRTPNKGVYQIPPADHRTLTLTCIERKTGRLIHKAPITLNNHGSFSTRFLIPPSMKNGPIIATLSRKEGETKVAYDTHIIVKNEQRNRVVLTLEFPRTWTTPGEKVTGKITARYHWGAAVTNREVEVTLPNGVKLKLPTDAEGNTTFDFDTSMQASGSIATFVATMPSESSNVVRKPLDIDPLGFSIEADLSHATIAAGETFEVIAKTLLPDASATSKELTLEVVQQHIEKSDPILGPSQTQRRQLSQRSNVQTIQIYSSPIREEIMQSHKLTTDAKEGLAKQKITLKEGGRFILRIRGTDDRGRLVFAESFIEIYGEDSTQKIRLLVDKNKLYEGGVAKIDAWSRLKTPTTALLSIEADELIEYRLIKLNPGKNNIELPLNERHAPVFRVAIMAMHERKFYASDEILPVERLLKVAVEILGLNKDLEATPATQLKVKVNVKDGNDKPQDAEVSLALVDDRDPHNAINISPFIRSPQLAGFALGTSCGLQHQGAQSRVNLALRAEEQRLNNAPGRAGHRAENNLQLALQQSTNRVDIIRKNLYMGEGYYNLGKYDQAEQQFKKILQVDQYNKAARRWLERVSSVKSDYYRAAYDHTRAELLAQVDGAWEADDDPFGGGGQNDPPELPNSVGVSGGGLLPQRNGISNLATSGLRSGDYATTRNNIDAILNNPNRNSIDAVLNNANGRGFLNNSSNANWSTRNYFSYSGQIGNGSLLLPNSVGLGLSSAFSNTITPSHQPTQIWAISLQKVSKAGTTLEVPLPDRSGSWKLLTHASTASGNIGQSIEKLLTRQPYTLSLESPSVVIEGDKLTPAVILTRKNTDADETININLSAVADDKEVHSQKLAFQFKKGESTREVSAQSITVPEARMIGLTITGDKQLELKRNLSIRPWGLPVANHHSSLIGTGKKSISLELPAATRRQTMQLNVIPGMSQALRRLATSTHAPLHGWDIPFQQAHPAGKLLAICAVIDQARQQGLGDDTMTDLIEQANRLAAELAVRRNNDGSWAPVTGRSKGELSQTAMAFEALKLAEKLKINVDSKTITTSQAWLAKQQSSIQSSDVDARALVQYALSCADAADFSTCNRLFRERGKLSDAGKALLAATFVNLKRPENAKTLLSALGKPDDWSVKSQRILCSKTFIAGRALMASAAVSPDSPLTASLRQFVFANAGAGGFTSDLDRGAALVGLCRAEGKWGDADAKISITLNGKSLGDFTTDKPELLANISIPSKLLTEGKNTLSFSMEGKGKLHAAATLSGFKPIPAKADVDEKFAIKTHSYFRQGLSFQGRQLRAHGTSPAKTVRAGERVKVHFTVSHYRNDIRDAVLIERIPAGFVYEKGSLTGTHSGARIENNHLVLTFDGGFKHSAFSYRIIARQPGTWRQPPTMLIPLRNPSAAVHGTSGTLTVIPATEKSPDVYVMNVSEHSELAALHFKQGNQIEARKHIMAIRKASPNWENPEHSRMLLWIETASPKPDARLLVESFEILNERTPDLVIPFDKILKVGKAYQELKEHERGLEVFTATIEAGFAKDAYVGAALEDQGRFLDSVDYQKTLWKLYPDEGQITEAWFALSQQVYLMAAKAEKMQPRHGQKKPPTEIELIKESSSLLDSFLVSTPENPMADDAAFSQANALFSLKEYKQVVKYAHACIARYPDSKHAGSFRYMEALGSFWLRDYDAALKAASEVAHGSSEDRNLAAFITAQVYHAKGQPIKAMEWYEVVKAIYPDALESIAYFEQKMVKLDEAKILKSGEKAQIKLRHRNIKEAHLQIYRVDLMKLYLREKSLSNVANVNLAGIAPKHEMTVKLGDGEDFRDRETLVTLPVKNDGAYLVICRGDYLYTSGLALITPLKMEVQEDLTAHSLRVNISDQTTGKYLDNVHVKAIGLNDSRFKSGETDLRGVWKAEGITDRPTVIARDKKGRYAFFRSTSKYLQQGGSGGGGADQQAKPSLKKVDFNSNINMKQLQIQKGNNDKYDQMRRSKGKGVKAEKAIKK